MALFTDLPFDLIPLIVAGLLEPVHIAPLCLVNKTFYTFSIPTLYERISIYAWQQSSKLRVSQLFRTLSERPDLARYVRQLVIQDFPKAQDAFANEHVRDLCTRGLENCLQLRRCTWTRDGSLTSHTLRSLGKCPELTDISINGRHLGFYEPEDLLHLLHLHKISLIAPSTPVLQILPSWIQATTKSLTSLSLTSGECFNITDALLESVSTHLSRLERFHLAGCPRVTNEGVWSVIRSRIRDLKELSLEELSPFFNMSALSADCARAGGLTLLSSFTFTVHPDCSTYKWMDGTISLIKNSHLESVQLDATDFCSKSPEVKPGDRFCMRIVDQNCDHLVHFSLPGLQLGLPSIDHLCLHCAKLEHLFIRVDHSSAVDAPTHLIAALAQARHLRTVLITFNERLELSSPYAYALDIARQCSPTISQVGIQRRVWKVERRVVVVNGTVQVDRFLTDARKTDVPEQFFVLRM